MRFVPLLVSLLVAAAGRYIGANPDCNYAQCTMLSGGIIVVGLGFAVLGLIVALAQKGPKQF